MEVVGVNELKAKLSEYLRLVRQGEVVLVTDRDAVVAEMRTATRSSGPPARFPSLIVADMNGFSPSRVRQIVRIIGTHHASLVEAWHEHFRD